MNNKYEVVPVYGMISQDGKTFCWNGANKDCTVTGSKTATNIGLFQDCPSNMPVIDLRGCTNDDEILSVMFVHAVLEVTVKTQRGPNAIVLEEFLALARRRGMVITTVQQVQEDALAERMN